MGSGIWSPDTYHGHVADLARTGKDAFDYSAAAVRSGLLRVHQTLDPHGLVVRESRDSEEHPESNAIIIGLDVTGSMERVVRGIHADLPRLHELLLAHRCVPHPQVMFAAVGDATCDQVPLQVGQFESDNRMDRHLENMILEGGGGGQKTESYELLLYLAARHTAIDCWEKRRRKGYLFVIGDEMAYRAAKQGEVRRLFGRGPQQDVPIADVVREAQERYHVFFLVPGGAAHGGDRQVLAFWERLLGRDHVIRLDSPDETSECIALTIGVNEGTISRQDAPPALRQLGWMSRTVDRVASLFG